VFRFAAFVKALARFRCDLSLAKPLLVIMGKQFLEREVRSYLVERR